jgi:hypothetical protein
MFYNPYDEKKLHLAFWISLIAMFALFIFLFNDNIKIPQKEVTLEIDIKNKVNICVPEDEKIFEESFFDF